MNRIDVLGVEFDDMDIVEAVELAMSFMDERRCAYAVTPNPEIVLASRKNRKLAAAIRSADMALAGIESRIDVDEVIDAMGEVGRRLPVEFRETALGGLAATPTGKAVKKRMRHSTPEPQ